MKCPNCNVDLLMTERSGIQIDYCPQCRGIWLDRGKLDKLIEKYQQSALAQPQAQTSYQPQYPQRDHHDDHYYDKHDHDRRKKGGLLGKILDF